MTKTEVLNYYKTGKAVAAVLDISESAVSQWPEVIPRLRAYELERASDGALRLSGAAQGARAA